MVSTKEAKKPGKDLGGAGAIVSSLREKILNPMVKAAES
jgi:hypothetical protein